MEKVSVKSVVVVLDGTKGTVDLVAELSRRGTRVTAVGENFRDVVSVLSGDVYALVADLADPEQWETALLRAERRHGTVEQILDPAGRLAPLAA
ncbi:MULTISPECIES: short-chain dehydrogenase [Tsukamurella]|uniref:Short-chain dehydrogenase n=1 Tax=Tsukamurella strandjordii TaxID=147577 RepID=A0AA90NEF4_9ACTN|nr:MULTISPECIES: short-chain dehydrogenase [Tsukamurella]MDP0400450.1 short-chain dehydrogenase [Tsukamurella strandjordii]GIZ98319.1 hypothetical protein TTY48_29310 [Tsukamurella sp. TY48]